MDNPGNGRVQFLQRQISSLLIYQFVLSTEVGNAFIELLQSIRYTDVDARGCLEAYGKYFQSLANQNQNWEEYLITRILADDNPFSKLAQRSTFAELPPALIAAVHHDLQILQNLYECSSAVLSEWVQIAAHLPISPIVWYTEYNDIGNSETSLLINHLQELANWGDAVEDLANYYQNFGTGVFTAYSALRWYEGKFIGINYPDRVSLKQLVGYESQRDILVKNTEFLLSGHVALDILLYGSRGSGKSSLVKALLNHYTNQKLRLLEVSKSELQDLPEIMEKLHLLPHKFIVFVDDLSFEEDDDAFKALKVVLEGSITARPQNVVVYATSNRRHLIREFFGDRPKLKDKDEIQAWDTMQEKLSFSDRFGLTLTFEPADQDKYLHIVQHLAKQAKINMEPEELIANALQWATRHNGRSGRTARQFIEFLTASLATQPKFAFAEKFDELKSNYN
ncbi:MAG: ATP-binding protein [Richelia sp.]|nr:ATP-binding protein [Richelia sp.]